jgi:hypothetical protein
LNVLNAASISIAKTNTIAQLADAKVAAKGENAMRTLEQRLKFDSGLTVGIHVVRFTLGERHVDVAVRISTKGKVSYLKKPDEGGMYVTWRNVQGDKVTADGPVIVWAARTNPELMAIFEQPIAATLELFRKQEKPI